MSPPNLPCFPISVVASNYLLWTLAVSYGAEFNPKREQKISLQLWYFFLTLGSCSKLY